MTSGMQAFPVMQEVASMLPADNHERGRALRNRAVTEYIVRLTDGRTEQALCRKYTLRIELNEKRGVMVNDKLTPLKQLRLSDLRKWL